MPEPLRIAVLGVGLMGAFHVDALSKRIRGARVVVVNDFFADKAAAVAESVGARVVADPIEAISDPEVDAVLIASPGAAHEEQVNACLDRRPSGALREAADHRHRFGVPDRAAGSGARHGPWFRSGSCGVSTPSTSRFGN